MKMSAEMLQKLRQFQRTEITEYHIYRKLAARVSSPENRRTLERIAEEERQHYLHWKAYTEQDIEPNRLSIVLYYLISRILGFTFGVKLMERNEGNVQIIYDRLRETLPESEVDEIIRQEEEHESTLLGMLDEDRIRYAGSIVLGLNDALVELTGALAGLTFALQNTSLIALTGMITGIAAALSMAASEYLATKSEPTIKIPLRAAIYTGVAYLVTVLILITPYLIFTNFYLCLALTLTEAILIIATFNYYISVAKDESFTNRFIEMAGLSLGVAAFSFLIGVLLRTLLGVEL